MTVVGLFWTGSVQSQPRAGREYLKTKQETKNEDTEQIPPKQNKVSAVQQFTRTGLRPSKERRKEKENFCTLDLHQTHSRQRSLVIPSREALM